MSALANRTITASSAASTTPISARLVLRLTSSMTVAIEPGPAIIGIAIGNTETSSINSPPACPAFTFSARCSRRWVRFSNTMSSAIRNSMIPPAMRNASSPMCIAPSSACPNSAKATRMSPAMIVARIAIVRACAVLAPATSPA